MSFREGDPRLGIDSSSEASEELPRVTLRTYIDTRDNAVETFTVTILENAAREGRDLDEVVDEALQAGRTEWDNSQQATHPQTRQALDEVSVLVPENQKFPARNLSFQEILDARDTLFNGLVGGGVHHRIVGVPIREVVGTTFREARQIWDRTISKSITDAYDQTLIPVQKAPVDTLE